MMMAMMTIMIKITKITKITKMRMMMIKEKPWGRGLNCFSAYSCDGNEYFVNDDSFDNDDDNNDDDDNMTTMVVITIMMMTMMLQAKPWGRDARGLNCFSAATQLLLW